MITVNTNINTNVNTNANTNVNTNKITELFDSYDDTQKILSDFDLYFEYINAYMDTIFSTFNKKCSKFKNINYIKQLIPKLEKKYGGSYKTGSKKMSYKLFILHVKSDYTISLSDIDKGKMTNNSDDRFLHIYNMVIDTLKYCKTKGLDVPNTSLHMFIADRYFFELELEGIRFPFIVISTPANSYYPLFPDNTFKCFSFDQRFGKKCSDWDETKKLIRDNLKDVDDDRLLFKGKNTSKYRTSVRKFFNIHQNKKLMDIQLIEDGLYEPMYNFSRYKYFLDLPGNYEWSNRLPRLLLMNRVTFKFTNDIKEYSEHPIIAFTDLLIRKNKHFIEIKRELSNKKKNNEPIIKKVIKNISKRLEKLNHNDKKYNQIASAGHKLMNTFSNTHIHVYIYLLIVNNHKFFG